MVKNAYILNPLSNKIAEFYMTLIVVWRWAARVPVIYGNQHGMPFQGEWVCGKELHTMAVQPTAMYYPMVCDPL